MNVQIPDGVREIMAELASTVSFARNPRTNKEINFSLSCGKHKYIYFRGNDGNDYCYTPHADIEGWYYSFAYIGVGRGSHSGKAKKFKMRYLRCHRKRKNARCRALKLSIVKGRCDG